MSQSAFRAGAAGAFGVLAVLGGLVVAGLVALAIWSRLDQARGADFASGMVQATDLAAICRTAATRAGVAEADPVGGSFRMLGDTADVTCPMRTVDGRRLTVSFLAKCGRAAAACVEAARVAP